MTADGTNSSKYASRGRFLDGTGEIVSSLRVNGVGNGGGGLDKRLISLYPFSTVNTGNTHTNVSTSLDIRSSTVPTRDPLGRKGEKVFRVRQSSPLALYDDGMDRLTTFW